METLPDTSTKRIAIIGNPNAGKTTVFNALTGLRQKVANYPGVTIEKKEGVLVLPDGTESTLLDLPGTYSLTANSPDEKIATDVLLGQMEGERVPDLVICVVDASNIERNLYLVSQIIDHHIPVVIALNMIDVAEQMGTSIDIRALSAKLGVPVIRTVATRGTGIEELRSAAAGNVSPSGKARQWTIPKEVREKCDAIAALLQEHHRLPEPLAFHEAAALLAHGANGHGDHPSRYDARILRHARADSQKLDFLGFDCQSLFVESRYEWIQSVCAEAVLTPGRGEKGDLTLSDKIDAVLTHKVWGFVVFLAIMMVMFQAIFTWATVPMNLIGRAFDWAGGSLTRILPPGDVQSLLVNGALAGVGAVVTFLPQIMFLFLFIGLLEDTGYMARAAFIMDRLMGKVGLHGKSFIPMLSSFACAIPGIMATRTIENRKDRLATMLVAPLMSCSARLPVYTLLISAFIPHRMFLGVFSLPGLTLVSLYLFGLCVALGMAWLLKRTLLKGETPAFIMELPPYKLPSARSIFLQVWERARLFLKRAGTIILGVSIVLWFLATYPRVEQGTPSERLQQSYAGQAGRLIEPLIRPLGFDWKIGIGLVTSLLQREVFVSTMGTIYNIRDAKNAASGAGGVGETLSLRERLQQDSGSGPPGSGSSGFTVLTAICLMVYYLLAMQCMSTVAVMRRETNGWKWPLFQLAYMTALAYGVTFIVYRVGLLIMSS